MSAAGSGAWIAEYREANGLTLEQLGRALRRYGERKKPGWPRRCSDKLLDYLENAPKCVTHPNIADMIADALGATTEQRDAIVARRHRGTWRPKGPGELNEPTAAPRGIWTRNAQGRLNFFKPVVVVDREGRTLREYESEKLAARSEGVSSAAVSIRCNRLLKTDEFDLLRGVTFRYAADWDGLSARERMEDLARGALDKTRPNERRVTGAPVVAINPKGEVVGRWKTMGECMRAEKHGYNVIYDRCEGTIVNDEFAKYMRTWRYAEEWDRMSREARAADLELAKRPGAPRRSVLAGLGE